MIHSAKKGKSRYAAAIQAGYRSGLEVEITQQLDHAGIPFKYEPLLVRYYHNQKRRYKPDLLLLHTGIYVELKGHFSLADRTKHLLVRDQHPELDIRFVFQNANQKLAKQTKMTQGKWATANGFQWAHKTIPKEWYTNDKIDTASG